MDIYQNILFYREACITYKMYKPYENYMYFIKMLNIEKIAIVQYK